MEKYILELFEKLEAEIIKYNPYYSKELINKAFLYSYQAHKNQIRKSKELYIIHPLYTALNLTKIEADDISIVWALLHDVLDNKLYNIEDIEKNFWKEIKNIIVWVNKLWDLYYTLDMNEKDIENLKKSLVNVWDDIRIFLIKIADRLHNLETLYFLPKQKRYRIARETEEIYLPIVNFLSIWEFLTQMQDLCFKYTYEDEYKKLTNIFWKRYKHNEKKIIDTHSLILQEFKKSWISVVNIEWRVKSFYSIYKKINYKNLDPNNIWDILALRVITKNIKDCYVILGILHRIFKANFDRFKDYISSPKNNWYQSIHTTVYDNFGDLIEFQIQTTKMYQLNKTGLAAHFLYKWFGIEYNQMPKWMNNILNLQRKTIDQKWFIKILKDEVVISEIKCFKENWKWIILPKDSVLIDFAFENWINYGKYFSWAYVNWVYTQDAFLKLKNWDYIKLEYSINIKKDYNIENFFLIKTQKAREQIKNIFQKYSKTSLINLWKHILNNSLETYSYRLFEYFPEKTKKEIIKSFWLSSEEQFYLFISLWSIDLDKVIKKIILSYDKKDFVRKVNLRIYTKTQDFMTINNITNIIYNLDLVIEKMNFDKNIINISLLVDWKKTFDYVLSELRRAPNVLQIRRIFLTRLKIFYFMLFVVLFLILIFVVLVEIFNLPNYEKQYILDLFLFISACFLFWIIYFMKYLIKTVLPDVLKYKRFWLSFFWLNSLILLIIFWEIINLWINISFILYFIFSISIYLILFFDFLKYKKTYNLKK